MYEWKLCRTHKLLHRICTKLLHRICKLLYRICKLLCHTFKLLPCVQYAQKGYAIGCVIYILHVCHKISLVCNQKILVKHSWHFPFALRCWESWMWWMTAVHHRSSTSPISLLVLVCQLGVANQRGGREVLLFLRAMASLLCIIQLCVTTQDRLRVRMPSNRGAISLHVATVLWKCMLSAHKVCVLWSSSLGQIYTC